MGFFDSIVGNVVGTVVTPIEQIGGSMLPPGFLGGGRPNNIRKGGSPRETAVTPGQATAIDRGYNPESMQRDEWITYAAAAGLGGLVAYLIFRREPIYRTKNYLQ